MFLMSGYELSVYGFLRGSVYTNIFWNREQVHEKALNNLILHAHMLDELFINPSKMYQ